MDKLEYYRRTIKTLLTEYYEMTIKGARVSDELETDNRLAFDEERSQYLWFRSGWESKHRISHITMYLQQRYS